MPIRETVDPLNTPGIALWDLIGNAMNSRTGQNIMDILGAAGDATQGIPGNPLVPALGVVPKLLKSARKASVLKALSSAEKALSAPGVKSKIPSWIDDLVNERNVLFFKTGFSDKGVGLSKNPYKRKTVAPILENFENATGLNPSISPNLMMARKDKNTIKTSYLPLFEKADKTGFAQRPSNMSLDEWDRVKNLYNRDRMTTWYYDPKIREKYPFPSEEKLKDYAIKQNLELKKAIRNINSYTADYDFLINPLYKKHNPKTSLKERGMRGPSGISLARVPYFESIGKRPVTLVFDKEKIPETFPIKEAGFGKGSSAVTYGGHKSNYPLSNPFEFEERTRLKDVPINEKTLKGVYRHPSLEYPYSLRSEDFPKGTKIEDFNNTKTMLLEVPWAKEETKSARQAAFDAFLASSSKQKPHQFRGITKKEAEELVKNKKKPAIDLVEEVELPWESEVVKKPLYDDELDDILNQSYEEKKPVSLSKMLTDYMYSSPELGIKHYYSLESKLPKPGEWSLTPTHKVQEQIESWIKKHMGLLPEEYDINTVPKEFTKAFHAAIAPAKYQNVKPVSAASSQKSGKINVLEALKTPVGFESLKKKIWTAKLPKPGDWTYIHPEQETQTVEKWAKENLDLEPGSYDLYSLPSEFFDAFNLAFYSKGK